MWVAVQQHRLLAAHTVKCQPHYGENLTSSCTTGCQWQPISGDHGTCADRRPVSQPWSSKEAARNECGFMSTLKWGYLIQVMGVLTVGKQQSKRAYGEARKEGVRSHHPAARCFLGTPGAGTTVQKPQQQNSVQHGWAGTLAGYWLPYGMIVFVIWKMFQAGRYLVFKQTHF